MTREKFGTVAALQYAKRPKLDFATVVKEFDNSFQLIEGQERSQTWICRDIVIIDREVVRVALGWLNPTSPEAPWHLIVAIGGTPKQTESAPAPDYFEALSQYIVGHFSYILPYDAILHGSANRPISSAVVRTVTDLLRLSENTVSDEILNIDTPCDGDELTLPSEQPERISDACLNEVLHETSGEIEHEINILDETEVPPPHVMASTPEEAISLPKRLTIYTLGLTMAMQVPPVGAFLLTYAALRDGAVTIN